MKKMVQCAVLVLMTLACVTIALAKMPRKATWKDFEGDWREETESGT